MYEALERVAVFLLLDLFTKLGLRVVVARLWSAGDQDPVVGL